MQIIVEELGKEIGHPYLLQVSRKGRVISSQIVLGKDNADSQNICKAAIEKAKEFIARSTNLSSEVVTVKWLYLAANTTTEQGS